MTDGFHLVRPVADPDAHDAGRAHQGLLARRMPETLHDFTASARHFQLEDELAAAINMALAVGAPLLLTGEPGTGKTQVAYFLGWYFGIHVYDFQVKSLSTARDLEYDFDAVAYLRSAEHPELDGRKDRSEFLKPGPLWRAYEDERLSVVLIDEIDKAPRDFPNDLLQELDKHAFDHPFDKDELGRPLKVRAPQGRPPIVVITSNAERRLPDPFLRRCIFHKLELDKELVGRVVLARKADFPSLDEALVARALDRFFELRAIDELEKKPSTAELLVWLTILSARGTSARELEVGAAELPALNALVKDAEDRGKL